MLETVEEYLAWILDRIGRTETMAQALPTSFGMALAEDVRARHDLPMWDASAMDGYAVRAADIGAAEFDGAASAANESAIRLKVVGEVAAGSDEDPTIPESGAVRAMTGAPVPSDADTVIPVELTESDRSDDCWAHETLRILRPVELGANIRRRGEDIRAGDLVGRSGDRLTAARMSAIAASGIESVRVRRAPRIAVVTTGSELTRAGGELRRGRIPESNSVLMVGMLRDAGLEAATIEHCEDDVELLTARLAKLAASHDAIVTTGGIGPGIHDIVRMALTGEPEIRALRVALRPGQLQCAGRHSGGAFVFALPGNPVSVAVSFEMFVRPALLSLAGFSRIQRLRLSAIAAEAWSGKIGPLKVLPVRIEQGSDGLTCAPAVAAKRVSHSVAGHGDCDGYAIVEADRGAVCVGETVQVIQVGVR